MTEEQKSTADLLGERVIDLLGTREEDNRVDVNFDLLQDNGIPFRSKPYCDWLTKFKLRQLRPGRTYVPIVRQ